MLQRFSVQSYRPGHRVQLSDLSYQVRGDETTGVWVYRCIGLLGGMYACVYDG